MTDHGVVTEPGTVRIQRILPGPIERVWAFLTESEQRGRWLAAGPMEPRVGGAVALHFRNDELSDGERAPEKYRDSECRQAQVDGRVIAWEPPRRLAYSWGGGSEVTFELTPEAAGVRLVLTHRRLPDREQMLGVSAGWHAHLDVLAARVNGDKPAPFWDAWLALKEDYAARLPE